MSYLQFFKEAIKNFRSTGAVAQSSRFLINKMLNPINFDNARNIVELGPGNGCVTRKILDRMHPAAQLTSFEINPEFYNITKQIHDQRFNIRNDSATELSNFFEKRSIDCVISCVPLANMPEDISKQILQEVKRILKKDGLFIQFQYSLNAKKSIEENFDQVELKFTPLNIPPAFVYIAQ